MAGIVRAALVQATWTGDTASMVAKHEEHARDAARQGARIIGFQEVFNADPRGQFVGDVAGDTKEELVVRDLDFDLIDQVRQQWAFYRDRRPDAYEGLVQP